MPHSIILFLLLNALDSFVIAGPHK